MLCDVDEKWGRRRSPWGCSYSFVNHSLVTCGCRQGGLRSAPIAGGLRKARFSSGALGRVGHLVPHDRVDHLQSLPRDRLERFAVRHPPVPALPVELAEPVVAPDQRVAREYERALQALVPLAGRRDRRYGGSRLPVTGRRPAVLLNASDPMLRTWSTTTRVSSGALEKGSLRSATLFATEAFRAISLLGGHEAGPMGPLADVDSEHGPGARRRFHDGILLIVDRSESVRATPTLPGRGLVCARQFPISRPERRPPPVAAPPREPSMGVFSQAWLSVLSTDFFRVRARKFFGFRHGRAGASLPSRLPEHQALLQPVARSTELH